MERNAEKFALLLSEAIHRIRLEEDKPIRVIQDELGYALGRQGGSAIERWRKGYLPPKAEDIEQLAHIFVKRAGFERPWITTFLQSAGYPHANALIQKLFPSISELAAVASSPATTAIPSVAQDNKWSNQQYFMVGVAVIIILSLAFFSFVRISSSSTLLPTPAPLSIFPDEPYGVLLLALSEDKQAQELMAVSQGSLRALLAQTGLSSQVNSQTHTLTKEQAVVEVLQQSGADMAVNILVFPDQIKQLEYLLAEPTPGLQAIVSSLSEPFVTDTAVQTSDQIALRLALIVNAAMGFDALLLGEHESCSRRFNAVLSLAEQLKDSFSRHDVAYITLGVCLEALGQAEVAREQYELALSFNSNLAQAHYGLGNYWYVHYDFEQARHYYEQAIVLAASDPLASAEVIARARAGLGNIALAEAKPAEAIAALNEAIAHDNTEPAYYFARAMAFIALKSKKEAVEDLNQCLELVSAMAGNPSAYWRQVEKDCETWLQGLQTTPASTATATFTSTAVSPVFTPSQLATPLPPTVRPSRVPVIPAQTPIGPTVAPVPTDIPSSTLLPPTIQVTGTSPPTVTILPTIPATATILPTIPATATILPTIPATSTKTPPPGGAGHHGP